MPCTDSPTYSLSTRSSRKTMQMVINLLDSSTQFSNSDHRRLKSSSRLVFRFVSISVLMEIFSLRTPHRMIHHTRLSGWALTSTLWWECQSSCNLGKCSKTWATTTPLTTSYWRWCSKTSKTSARGPWLIPFCSLLSRTQERKVSRPESLTTCSKPTRQVTLWRKTKWTSLRHSNGRQIPTTTRGLSERTIATSTGSRSSSPSVSLMRRLMLASVSIRKHTRLWFKSSTRASLLTCRYQVLSYLRKSGRRHSSSLHSYPTLSDATSRVRIGHSPWQEVIARLASCKRSLSVPMSFQLSSIFGVSQRSLRSCSNSQTKACTKKWGTSWKSLYKRHQNTFY